MINDCKRETDRMYKKEILKNASLNCIPNITDLPKQDDQLSTPMSDGLVSFEKKVKNSSKLSQKKRMYGTLVGFYTPIHT